MKILTTHNYYVICWRSKANIIKMVKVAKTNATIAAIVNCVSACLSMLPKRVEIVIHNISSIMIITGKKVQKKVFNLVDKAKLLFMLKMEK